MITVQLTNGFGNNLFQYIAAKLLAEHHGQEVGALLPSHDYYALGDLKKMGVNIVSECLPSVIPINEFNYMAAHQERYKNNDFHLTGYFEDHTFFKDNIDLIKQWHPLNEDKRPSTDLVVHFRAGDRLFYKNEFDYKPSVTSYLEAIKQFEFENLYIVTDMPKWEYITTKDLNQMKFHVDVPSQDKVPIEKSVDYFNSFVDAFNGFKPIINNKKNRSVYDDFNFIRTFDNILFQHGTLGWWAAILSDASKVGVYGPWRPWKGKNNKNLSKIDLPGWFQWS